LRFTDAAARRLRDTSRTQPIAAPKTESTVAEQSDLLKLIQAFRANQPEPSPTWLAKRQLAAQLRRINHVLCDSAASETELWALAELAAEKAEWLESLERDPGAASAGRATVPGMETFYDRGPLVGRSNPIAPPASLDIDVERRRVVGEVEFGRAFEGAPGCVHGGFASAVLDEALGMACIFGGGPAMTAELTTRFLHHVPIETPLAIEARLDGVDGRKVRTSGSLCAQGVAVVEASGLFIEVGSQKFEALVDSQQDRER
jgi:acyl-coenzyme A thioesterase PaaI-like protein